MKKLKAPQSGYPGPGNRLYETVEDYCLAYVREDYAHDRISAEQLDAKIDAALRGDYAETTPSPFLPFLMETVWM